LSKLIYIIGVELNVDKCEVNAFSTLIGFQNPSHPSSISVLNCGNICKHFLFVYNIKKNTIFFAYMFLASINLPFGLVRSHQKLEYLYLKLVYILFKDRGRRDYSGRTDIFKNYRTTSFKQEDTGMLQIVIRLHNVE